MIARAESLPLVTGIQRLFSDVVNQFRGGGSTLFRASRKKALSESAARQHIKPFVWRTLTTKSLHFSREEAQSCMSVRQPNALKLDYTRTMMGFLLFVSEPADIAMIGLGGGSLAKFCHHHLQTSRVYVVEINPHVIALRDEFLVPPDGDRFCVVRCDGAEFVRLTPKRFDVLLVDGYDHRGLPESLSSQKFYDACFERLTPGGMLVANLDIDEKCYRHQVERIRRSFSGAVVVVENDKYCNSVVFASKKPLALLLRDGAMRKPHDLDDSAWEDLQHSFARILSLIPSQPP